MDKKFLEHFYEVVVLPRYDATVRLDNITWSGHDKVGLDAWAHYFRSGDTEYVLVYEDYPGEVPFGDGLSHELIKLDDLYNIELKFSDDKGQVPNILGWFTLFREKKR